LQSVVFPEICRYDNVTLSPLLLPGAQAEWGLRYRIYEICSEKEKCPNTLVHYLYIKKYYFKKWFVNIMLLVHVSPFNNKTNSGHSLMVFVIY